MGTFCEPDQKMGAFRGRFFGKNSEGVDALSHSWERENSEGVDALSHSWERENSEGVDALSHSWKGKIVKELTRCLIVGKGKTVCWYHPLRVFVCVGNNGCTLLALGRLLAAAKTRGKMGKFCCRSRDF